jgi:hypothetical protein
VDQAAARAALIGTADARLARALAWRLPLFVALMLLAQRGEWAWLRWVTAEAGLRLAVARGFAAERLSFDTIAWGGQAYVYVPACTYVDIAVGSIALVVVRGAGWADNLARAAQAVLLILLLNQVKALAIDLLVGWGAPFAPVVILLNGALYTWLFFRLTDALRERLAPVPARA